MKCAANALWDLGCSSGSRCWVEHHYDASQLFSHHLRVDLWAPIDKAQWTTYHFFSHFKWVYASSGTRIRKGQSLNFQIYFIRIDFLTVIVFCLLGTIEVISTLNTSFESFYAFFSTSLCHIYLGNMTKDCALVLVVAKAIEGKELNHSWKMLLETRAGLPG